ncbi:MAG: RNA polymerase factor sigma-54 [Chitinophagales bacterium]|nr:RNA polymerase factor sigma-54 [Chitinophagales bacterium]MDW8394524.1 RNA polymerase factor sigma-54 [Chitinophagales bacterium]
MLRQGLQQKLTMKLSPQQIQLIKLLQIPTDALEQRIKEELEANPALEEGPSEDETDLQITAEEENPSLDGSADTDWSADKEAETSDAENEHATEDEQQVAEQMEYERQSSEDSLVSDFLDDDEVPDYRTQEEPDSEAELPSGFRVPVSRSFHEHLEEQLGLEELSEHHYLLGTFLIGSIDHDGYLRRPLDAIVDDLAFTQNIITTEAELEDVLRRIQRMDPPGVGARDLRECLLLQLQREPDTNPLKTHAIRLLTDYFDEFVKKHYDKLQRHLQLDEETFKKVVQLITHLNPKPGSAFAGSQEFEKIIIPDFYIQNNEGRLELSLNSMNVPELRISQQYRDLLRDYSKGQKADRARREALQFVKQKISSAKWFIDAIRQRQQTLLLTMEAIMEHQKEFFLTGDETRLKPMILKDIADKTGLDISTVSRVANSKYVQTEFGTFRLKYFFSESLSTDSGEEVSTREVKKILSDLIALEDKRKPLSDEKLTKLLRQRGYNIARRTVAKYREQLDIPVARLRKEL